MKVWLCLALLVFGIIPVFGANGCNANDPECGAFPVDNCDVRMSTGFNPTMHRVDQGIDICASNIGLDCNNAILHYNNTQTTGMTTAINIDGFSNVYIANCNIFNYNRGINVVNANFLTISHNNISTIAQISTPGQAVTMAYSNNNTVEYNYISGTGGGIAFGFSDMNVIRKNIVTDTPARGIGVSTNSDINYIENNILLRNQAGIRNSCATNNIYFNNTVYFSRGNGIEFASQSSCPSFNNSVYVNNFCFNVLVSTGVDINNQGQNSGNNNTCDTSSNWNENGSTGCTFSCPPTMQADGSPILGNELRLHLYYRAYPDVPYVFAMAFGTTPGIALNDSRIIPLNDDLLLHLSLDPFTAFLIGLNNTYGITNPSSNVPFVSWNIPNISALANLTVYAAFAPVNYSATYPQNFIEISESIQLTLT